MRNILVGSWWWSTGIILSLLTFISNVLHRIQLFIWKFRYSVVNYIIDFGKPKEEEWE